MRTSNGREWYAGKGFQIVMAQLLRGFLNFWLQITRASIRKREDEEQHQAISFHQYMLRKKVLQSWCMFAKQSKLEKVRISRTSSLFHLDRPWNRKRITSECENFASMRFAVSWCDTKLVRNIALQKWRLFRFGTIGVVNEFIETGVWHYSGSWKKRN